VLIGLTGRHLEVRIKEHGKSDVKSAEKIKISQMCAPPDMSESNEVSTD
jgi:hypothetical protein